MSELRIVDAIDMHCHFGPDVLSTMPETEIASVTGLDAAREALASGHKALVLKSHSLGSAPVAFALQQMVPGLHVFGGICTDYATGGLNVEAVDASLRLGGKIVWLPTMHSHQEVLNGRAQRFAIKGQGLFVIGEDGRPTDVVREIFDLVRKHGAILATGHTTAAEHYAVVKEFASQGNMLIAHAGNTSGPRLTPEQCKDLADLGATVELTALTCDRMRSKVDKSPIRMVEMIRTVGHQRCTLSSDYGWGTSVPKPAAGLQSFLESLWSNGVSEADLATMVSRNPARLLGL